MKKITLLLIAVFGLTIGQAQITTPQPSPTGKMQQVVGLTDIAVEYSRPSMRGRKVFGNLVPFGKIWRTGANRNTTISFSDDVSFGGQKVKAGSYAIFTKPNASSWEVYLYTDTNNGGTPRKWDDAKVAAKTTIQTQQMPMEMNTFTIVIDDLTNNSAVLSMIWETTVASVKIEVPTVEKASKSIEAAMKGPSANDYYSAASYFFEEGKDLGKAKEWIDKAVSMNPKAFWMMRRQSLIYAKMGDKKGAIKAAKKSLEVAKAAKNADYVKMNQDSLKEWGGM